jgi:hypothetical protein
MDLPQQSVEYVYICPHTVLKKKNSNISADGSPAAVSAQPQDPVSVRTLLALLVQKYKY